jgi:hypothetical protein
MTIICKWETCKKEFHIKSKFHHHLMSHVNKQKQNYDCKFENCMYHSKQNAGLKRHVLVHVVDYLPFKCKNCETFFRRKCSLKKHKKQECYKKECKICNIIFRYRHSHVKHMSIHGIEFIQVVDLLFS